MLRPCGNWRWGKTTMLRTKMMLFTLLALAILAGCFDEGKVTGPVPLAEPQGIALAPTGACCYPDGSCEVADSLLCTEGGGDYQGELDGQGQAAKKRQDRQDDGGGAGP